MILLIAKSTNQLTCHYNNEFYGNKNILEKIPYLANSFECFVFSIFKSLSWCFPRVFSSQITLFFRHLFWKYLELFFLIIKRVKCRKQGGCLSVAQIKLTWFDPFWVKAPQNYFDWSKIKSSPTWGSSILFDFNVCFFHSL